MLGQEYFKFVILLGFGSGKVRGGLGDFLRGLGGVVKVGLVGRGWAGAGEGVRGWWRRGCGNVVGGVNC